MNLLSRLKRQFSKLLLVSAGILIAILISELIARRYFKIEAQLYTYDPSTGYTHRRNRSFVAIAPEFTVRYETNSLGLRGPEIDFENTDCMVLGLGDSFTFGTGVEYENTYLEVMRHILIDTLHIDLQVVNSGHGGWGTAQEAVFLEENIETYKPQLIVVGVFPNDVIDNTSPSLFVITPEGSLERTGVVPKSQTDALREQTDSIPLYGWLSENSALFGMIRIFVQNLMNVADTPVSQGTTNSPDDVVPHQEFDQFLIDLERLLFLRIRSIATAGESEAVFVFIPQLQEDNTLFINSELFDFCRENDLRCIDTRDALIDSSFPIESLYYEHDGHLNPIGHMLVGNVLADYIYRHRLLECDEVT